MPRWRIIIEPTLVFSPAKSLTPRYFGKESLPNLAEPVALVLAIFDITMLSKLIQFVKEHLDDIILLVGVILISLLSFAVGYIVAKQQDKEPIKFEQIEQNG